MRDVADLPAYETLLLTRRGRRLTITFNRPEVLNAFGPIMHGEIVEALRFAARDEGSDIIVLTGTGRAFSAGGDLARMEECIADPDEFTGEAVNAKALIFALLDIEKPVVARVMILDSGRLVFSGDWASFDASGETVSRYLAV